MLASWKSKVGVVVITLLLVASISLVLHVVSFSHPEKISKVTPTLNQTTNSTPQPFNPSPLFGPLLIVNVTGYNSYYSSNLQIWASNFTTGNITQVLEVTINADGIYRFVLPNVMLNESRSYLDGGFSSGSETSLTLFLSLNKQNPPPSYYNNVPFSPYSVIHDVVQMNVSGNITMLNSWFSGTGISPGAYTTINFDHYSMETTIWL